MLIEMKQLLAEREIVSFSRAVFFFFLFFGIPETINYGIERNKIKPFSLFFYCRYSFFCCCRFE